MGQAARVLACRADRDGGGATAWAYGTLASEVYDLDKPVGSSFGDVDFYRRRLEGLEGRVLEPGVGTGRILIPLLQAGVEVEGFDNSREMLAVCRQRCDERGLAPVLFHADMTNFRAGGLYSAVIVPAGTIALLDGPATLARALTCFRKCLKPGGRVIIDVEPPKLLIEPEPLRTWVAEESVWTLQTIHVEYDASKNQTTRWLRYEKWTNGVLAATELQIFCLQHWSISEFAGLLREAGFVDIAISADYSPGASPGSGNSVWTFDGMRIRD